VVLGVLGPVKFRYQLALSRVKRQVLAQSSLSAGIDYLCKSNLLPTIGAPQGAVRGTLALGRNKLGGARPC